MNFNHQARTLFGSLGLTPEQSEAIDDFFKKHQGSKISLSEMFEDASKQNFEEAQMLLVGYKAGEVVARTQTVEWIMNTVRTELGEDAVIKVANGLTAHN